MKIIHFLLALCASFFSSIIISQADDSSVKTKIVCFGDSITKRGYNEILGKELDVDTVMSGVAGHSTSQAMRRIKKDVLDHKPDIVVIFFGTNDLRVDAPRVYTNLEKYKKNLSSMIKQSRKIGAKPIICTLPPINIETYFTRHEKDLYEAEGGLKKMIEDYRQAAIDTAKKHNTPIVDLNTDLQKTPQWMSKDGVHPSREGTRIIAKLIIAKVKPLLP